MIRPGAVRVAATPMEYDTTTNYLGGPENGLCTTAYKHSTNGTLTIVITNLNNTAYTANITVNTSLAIDSYSARRTSSSERWAVVGPY
ncbi:MAG: hypothetical protein GTN78_10200, partial [Gemmatimonadales bacterium]|nr:hypothetical protein [Gemmatimonadales bacterium]